MAGLSVLGVVVVDSVAGLADLGVVVVDSLVGLADLGFGSTARVVEGWLGLVGVVVIWWLGVVDSVGLGLCRGLEWFYRWVWVFAEAWGG